MPTCRGDVLKSKISFPKGLLPGLFQPRQPMDQRCFYILLYIFIFT